MVFSEAVDGLRAFEIVSARPIDIVISDLMLPEMGGDEFCRKIRNDLSLKELPIIVLPMTDDKTEYFQIIARHYPYPYLEKLAWDIMIGGI